MNVIQEKNTTFKKEKIETQDNLKPWLTWAKTYTVNNASKYEKPFNEDVQEDSNSVEDVQEDSIENPNTPEENVLTSENLKEPCEYIEPYYAYVLSVDDEPTYYSNSRHKLERRCNKLLEKYSKEYLHLGMVSVSYKKNAYVVSITYRNILWSSERVLHILKISEVVAA